MKPIKTYRPSILNLKNLFLLILFTVSGYVVFFLKPEILWQILYLIFLLIVIDIQLFTKYIIYKNTLQIKAGITGVFGKQEIPLSKIQDLKTIEPSIKQGVFIMQLELIYNANDDYINLSPPPRKQDFIDYLIQSSQNSEEE